MLVLYLLSTTVIRSTVKNAVGTLKEQTITLILFPQSLWTPNHQEQGCETFLYVYMLLLGQKKKKIPLALLTGEEDPEAGDTARGVADPISTAAENTHQEKPPTITSC